jgi:N-acetylglucosaminyldiphosphoundecaprenol N-acetyl-beta-D-mannosaminyltransferase
VRRGTELPSFSLLGRRFYLGDEAGALAWLLGAGKGRASSAPTGHFGIAPEVGVGAELARPRQRPNIPRVVCVANVHTLVAGLWDRELREAQESADLSLADGRPLSLAGKFLGAWEARQLRGPDLMLSAAKAGLKRGARHYYYGGGPGVAAGVAAKLKSAVPGLKVAGAESPPFRALSDAELRALAARLKRAKANLLWVGLGAPKQEKIMRRLAGLDAPATMIGVGAAFDYYAGTKKEAPRWMMAASLEWLYRLGSEPRRLWKRYLGTNPLFLALLLSEHFGLYAPSAQSWPERLLRLACLPPFIAALEQGRPWPALAAFLMPAWLGRLFWLFVPGEIQ